MRPTRTTLTAFVLSVAALAGCSGGFPEAALSEGRGQTIAVFEQQVTGVAASESGRLFVCSPRWHTDGPMDAVLELLPGGTTRAYPDAAWNSWTPGDPDAAAKAPHRFVCVQSVHVDRAGRLWILDPGSPRLAGVVPGAPKLIEVDLSTDRVVRVIRFDDATAPKDSYLNDVRVDPRTDTAFISDSGRGGFVVVDLASGSSRRVLDRHATTLADPGFVPRVGGRELRFAGGPNAGQVPQVHSDGIALSPTGDYLYWQALTHRRLYRVPTNWLRGSDGRPERVAAQIEDLGETVMTDGMEMDAAGNLYLSALELDAVVVRRPDGTLVTLARGKDIAWPDSFALARGKVFVTAARIHETSWFTGADNPRGYPLVRLDRPARRAGLLPMLGITK